MPIDAFVFTGQLREADNFLELLQLIRSVSPRSMILFSTWEGEPVPLRVSRALASHGVDLVLTPPIRHDAWGSPLRQQLLLDRGMTSLGPADVVLKLRTDWVLRRASLKAIEAELGSPQPVLARSAVPVLRSRIVIPWWNPQIPFRMADEAFGGVAADLATINSVDWFMSCADPHTGRFIDVGIRSSWAVKEFHRQLMSVVFPEYSVRYRQYFEAAAGVRFSRLGFRLGANPLLLLRMMASTPLGQAALADYHFIAHDMFRVVNPTPDTDQFLVRVGGPWSRHGYVQRDGGCPVTEEGFLVSYDEIGLCSGCLTGLHASSVYSARAQALEHSGGKTLSDPLDSSLVEMSLRWIKRRARREIWPRVLSRATVARSQLRRS